MEKSDSVTYLEISDARIDYGPFSRRGWFGLVGLKHSITKYTLARAAEIAKPWPNDVLLVGSAMENKVRWDTDIIFIVENNQNLKLFSDLLWLMNKLGFEMGVYLDVRGTKELYPYNQLEGKSKEFIKKSSFLIEKYELSNTFVRDGKVIEYNSTRIGINLYQRSVMHPFDNVMKRMNKGQKLSSPIPLSNFLSK